jgi:hypothetical protein
MHAVSRLQVKHLFERLHGAIGQHTFGLKEEAGHFALQRSFTSYFVMPARARSKSSVSR